MAGPCWTAVILVLLLFAGNSSAAMDQNQLAKIVGEILNRYRPSYEAASGTGRVTRRYPMFSLAVSIPYNKAKKMYDISDLDSGEQVRNAILQCDVYTGRRVVAATVLRWPNVLSQCPGGRVQWPHVLRTCAQVTTRRVVTWADVDRLCPKAVSEGTADHAEYRTLRKFNTLFKNSKQDFLLFYVLASPCDKRCTSETSKWSILNSINTILHWDNYAVVFSDVFQPRGPSTIPENDLRDSLQRLGTHQFNQRSIGLNNIFRCNGNPVQCTSCSSSNQVTRYCYSDESQSGSSPNRPPSPPTSQNGQSDRDKQSSSINTSRWLSSNVDSNTGGGQGGSGSGLDSGSRGVKGKKQRARRKKQNKNNKDEAVGSSSQSVPKTSNTNVDSNTGGGQGKKAKKVGRRRVGKQRRAGGNQQKSKQSQSKKSKKGRERKSGEGQTGKQSQTVKQMRKINQVQRKGRKQKWG